MTQPQPEPQPAPPAAFMWQCGYSGDPGQRVCTAQLTQGALQAGFTLTPDDMDRLAAGLADCARQARTGLVRAAPAVPPLNGRPPARR